MNPQSRMPIREFSILTGISKDNLRFYDKIGLLSPQFRGENSYRYYTDRQIELAYLISNLRALGIGLAEIKRYADERSPERMLAFFSEQDARIEAEIERLRSIQDLMRLRSETATQALRCEEDIVFLEEKEREPIFLCPLPEKGTSDSDYLTHSYNYAAAHGVNTGFPYGAIVHWSQLQAGNWTLPSRYYFKVRKKHNAWKSAGLYAVLYRQIASASKEDFYQPLLAFVEENNLRIKGEVYEESPLDELSMHEWEQYKVRVEVQVQAPDENGAPVQSIS